MAQWPLRPSNPRDRRPVRARSWAGEKLAFWLSSLLHRRRVPGRASAAGSDRDGNSGMTTDSEAWAFQQLDRGALAAWDEARVLALAEMAYAAAPDFYDLMPLPHAGVIDLISKQLGAPNTETSSLYVLSQGDKEVALVCPLPAATLNRAKQDATLAIIRSLDRASRSKYMAALGRYTPTVEPFDSEGLYLTRLAVKASSRRSGVGAQAVQRFIDLGAGQPCSLHVKTDNASAIPLYEKFGFRFVSDRPFRFRAMLRQGRA